MKSLLEPSQCIKEPQGKDCIRVVASSVKFKSHQVATIALKEKGLGEQQISKQRNKVLRTFWRNFWVWFGHIQFTENHEDTLDILADQELSSEERS